MRGILKLAFKLLVNDRAKFAGLLVGITFSVFLMIAMTSLFVGILSRSSATVINIGAPVWVMDPAVNTVANSIGMPEYILDAIRSTKGVEYAVPLYTGGALLKLPNGKYQSVSVIGLDDSSLYGRPELEQGKIEDIYAENGFIVVDDAEFTKLDSPRIGAEFELNDHRGVVVGIAKVNSSGLFGVPTLYTTYERAIQYIPNPRYTISYILVQPKSPADIPGIERAATALGYRAMTKDAFIQMIIDFYVYQTGVGTNLLVMTAIAFVVGLSVSGLTFYTFILENLDKFGALKAMGAKSHELISMILFQSTSTALTGYGLGIGLWTLLLWIVRMRLADYAAMITYSNLAFAFGLVLIIAAISGYVGVRKVLKIEPFDIFRG